MMLPTLGWLKSETLSDAKIADSAELRVCIDSRKIETGDTFWALKGSRDGHEFVAETLLRGAAAAVVNRSFSTGNKSLDEKLIKVDDPYAALSTLAKIWRKRISGRVIGLTGSVGKTTTKDFVRAAFGDDTGIFATIGNLNNELGVPLTILRTPSEARVVICEMGAARIGDIEHLCAIADPQWGLVTAITEAHMETFGSIDQVMSGKGELYRHVATSGIAFVPVGDQRCVRASLGCKSRVGYGFAAPTSDWESEYVHGDELEFDAEAQAEFSVQGEHVKLSVPGRPAAQAALAAMTVAIHAGVPARRAARAISAATPTSGRVSVRKAGSVTIIDDSYNANPASMRSALETLSLRQSPRKIAILGDMLELGEYSDSAHREIVGELDHAGVSLAILIGPRFSDVAAASILQAQVRIFPAIDQALPTLHQLVRPGDLVLVKASRGMALDRAVQKIEESFS